MMIALSPLPAGALDLTGAAKISDGDTLAIGTQIIRIHGIDAFENGQNCERGGRSYNCGAASETALRTLISGRSITCSGTRFDGYERLIGVCTVDGLDVSAQMVRSGHALAYVAFSQDYVSEEAQARQERVGAWAGTFTAPWEFRANGWANAMQEAPDGKCPIKGNINSKADRIYHMPWSRSYRRTKINTAKGERWFCNEAQALEAGWRAPLR